MGALLIVFLTLFIGVTMFGRTHVIWRRTGINPYVLGKSDSAFDHIGRLFRVSLALIVSVIMVHAWVPAAYTLLTPIGWLERPWFDAVGVSVQMRQLSEACGEPLYIKHAEGVHLTEAGKGLLVHAQAISRAYENTKRYAKDRKDLLTGSLDLVASLTIGVYLLPELLAQFETQFPQPSIQLSTRYSQLALETLLSGQAELAFVELPAAQLTHLATEFVYNLDC